MPSVTKHRLRPWPATQKWIFRLQIFFAQQVVEKCLKAVAAHHGIVFRRTHDVDELVDLLLQHQVPMPFPPDQFSVLNPFAVMLRDEEISFVSMTLATMTELVELAYQWACAQTST